MAINIQNIIAALEAKVAAATSATETQELIVIIKSIKAAGQQTVVTYADVPNLPTASADNAGNLAYVAAAGKIYYSNGTTWTEVGSGAGGSSYDQSLNTTDDVVFNSALVGDVSIIGNEISSTDAYGNSSELLVTSPLTVQSNNLVEKVLVNTNMGASGSYDTFSSKIAINSTEADSFINSLSAGEQFSFELISSNGYTFTGTANFNYSQPNYYGGTDIFVTNMSSNGGSFETFLANSKLFKGSITQPLTVTATGVNVDGTFTVNGQPVSGGSGSSYDQSLNTTDDVVFNSSLIGDVSIIGNEISGIDACGNSSELVINAPTNIVATVDTLVTDGVTSNFDLSLTGSFPNNAIRFYQSYGWSTDQLNKLAALPSGTIVRSYFQIPSWGAAGEGYFVVDSVLDTTDYYGSRYLEITVSNLVVNGVGYNYASGALYHNGLSWTTGGTTKTTVLTATESGVNVEGSFTVNGQSIANYDQSLNTTDDVVFNSALVGDVSIVGNEISGTNAYGNPDTLILNSPVEFKKTVDTTTSVTPDFGSTSVQFSMNSLQIYNLPSQPSNVQQNAIALDALPVGTQVIAQFYDYGIYTNVQFRFAIGNVNLGYDPYNPSSLDSVTLYPQNSAEYSTNGGASWQPLYGTEYFNGNNLSISYSVDSIVTETVASVTESGLNVSNINSSTDLAIGVNTLTTSTTTLNMGGGGSLMWVRDNTNNKYYFLIDSSLYSQFSQYFNDGTVVTGFFDEAGKAGPFTFTLVGNASLRNIGADQGYAIETVQTIPGSRVNIWSSEITVSNTTGSTANYTFDEQGAFTTQSLVAESALIGDVSVVANTISAVDSYGNTDTLVVDGPLDINTQSTSTTNYDFSSPALSGQWDGMLSWNGTSLLWMNPSSATLTLIASLKAGDTVTLQDAMNGLNPVTVTLTSAMTYNMNAMGYQATTAENNTGMGVSAANTTITITSTIAKTSSFTSDGLALGGNVSFENELTFKTTVPQSNVINLNLGSATAYYGMGSIGVENLSNYQTEALQLDAIPAGTVVTFNNLFNPSTYENISIRFVVNTSNTYNDPYNPGNIVSVMFGSPTSVELSTDNGNTWSSIDLYANSAYNLNSSTGFVVSYTSETIIVKNVASIVDDGIIANNASIKSIGPAGTDGLQPTALISNGSVYAMTDDSGTTSRTQISPTTQITHAVVPGTAADGAVVERSVLSVVTSPTGQSSYYIPISAAASLNGDISIIEVVVSAINVAGTPAALTTKSWKLRAYAYKIDNGVIIAPIGTPEVLVNIDALGATGGTGGLFTSIASNGNNAVLEIGNTDTTGYSYTWGAEITVWTTHVNVSSGGGGK